MAKYKVVGESVVDGHKPGESFEADYSAVMAAQLIEGGHLKVLSKDKDSLLEQAIAAHVDAAESMTKAELAAALKLRTGAAQKGGK